MSLCIARASAGALGSPGFVAPEIILHGPHTPAMDVFSLGTVLFIMLVGRKPFNIQQCEDLSYCQLALADAPGLQDPRRALFFPLAPSSAHFKLPCKYQPKIRRNIKASINLHAVYM